MFWKLVIPRTRHHAKKLEFVQMDPTTTTKNQVIHTIKGNHANFTKDKK